jgi:F-type H+-transporting ATPase subunit delta
METTGLIASRYARALLEFSTQRGTAAQVFAEVHRLLTAIADEKAHEDDMGILSACIDTMGEEMRRFLTLVITNRRVDLLPFILHSYGTQYRKANAITTARLTTAAPAPELEQRLAALLSKRGYRKVDFVGDIDADLIGGFMLQVDDLRLDASVKSQLQTLREQFAEKNKRIV